MSSLVCGTGNLPREDCILPVVYFGSETGFLCCSQLDVSDILLPKLQSGEVRLAEVLCKWSLGFGNFGT